MIKPPGGLWEGKSMCKGPVVEKAKWGWEAEILRGAGARVMGGGWGGEKEVKTDRCAGQIGKSLVKERSLPRKGSRKSPRPCTQTLTEAVRSAPQKSCFTSGAESALTGGAASAAGRLPGQASGRGGRPGSEAGEERRVQAAVSRYGHRGSQRRERRRQSRLTWGPRAVPRPGKALRGT